MIGQTSLLAYNDQQIYQNMLRRNALMHAIRTHLTHEGFVEVDTPLICHWEDPLVSLGLVNQTKLHLRASLENYVRRCACAFNKAFEIGKCFRNEELVKCTDHLIRLPEFSMAEMYEVHIDLNGAIERMEFLLKSVVQKVMGSVQIAYQGKVLDFKAPFQRVKVLDAIERYGGSNAKRFAKKHKMAEPLPVQGEDGVLEELLDKYVKPNIFKPTFLTHFPKSADQYPDYSVNNEVYRAELIIANIEIGEVGHLQSSADKMEGYLRKTFSAHHETDEVEVLLKKEVDYLTEIRAFNRQVGGGGFGIDRLLMLLCNARDIRDVVWYPSWKI